MYITVQAERHYEELFAKTMKKYKLDYSLSETVKKEYFFEGEKFFQDFKIYEVEDLPESEWEVVKRFDHKDRIAFQFVPDNSNDNEARLNNCHCDLCNSNRYRVFTYLLRHKETGKYMQVGSNCIDKIFPHFPQFDNYCQFLTIKDEFEDHENLQPTAASSLPAKDVLVKAVALFKYFDNDYHRVKEVFDPLQHYRFLSDNDYRAAEPIAEQIMQYIIKFSGDNDYISNLKGIAKSNFVTIRNCKLWASAVTLIKNLNKLTNLKDEKIAILNQSIEHGWQTVYPLKSDFSQSKSKGSINDFKELMEEAREYDERGNSTSNNTFSW